VQFNAVWDNCGVKRIVPIALVALALFAIGFYVNARAPEAEVLGARKLCDLQDARINESSGLAASRRYSRDNLLWTQNDSGGKPEIYCVNLRGETVATALLQGATNVDWEDIGIAGDWIYIADTGDNWRRRENVTIYRVREPKLDPHKIGQSLEAVPEAMTLKYPDGAHDCETLLAIASGEVLLVSKNGGPSRIYKTPRPFRNGATQTLEQVGEYSFTGKSALSYLATGGSVAAGEKHLVIRTYTHAYEWTIPPRNDWKALWKTAPRVFELPPSKQGEGICYSADGRKYFTTSEGKHAPLFEVEPQRHRDTEIFEGEPGNRR
jgi:hypothetical protein